MTPGPLAALLDQLAAAREQLDALDAREAAHHAELSAQIAQLASLITPLSQALAAYTAALTRLTAPGQQVTRRLPGPGRDSHDGGNRDSHRDDHGHGHGHGDADADGDDGHGDGDRHGGDEGHDDDAGYQPRPAPAWHNLAPGERRAPVAELRDWAERVYRPGYGHLSAALGACWAQHDLCLYGLDIASQLWCALYLQPQRTTSLLSAQAEYQARILPAIAAQLAAETARCGHNPPAAYSRSAP